MGRDWMGWVVYVHNNRIGLGCLSVFLDEVLKINGFASLEIAVLLKYRQLEVIHGTSGSKKPKQYIIRIASNPSVYCRFQGPRPTSRTQNRHYLHTWLEKNMKML